MNEAAVTKKQVPPSRVVQTRVPGYFFWKPNIITRYIIFEFAYKRTSRTAWPVNAWIQTLSIRFVVLLNRHSDCWTIRTLAYVLSFTVFLLRIHHSAVNIRRQSPALHNPATPAPPYSFASCLSTQLPEQTDPVASMMFPMFMCAVFQTPSSALSLKQTDLTRTNDVLAIHEPSAYELLSYCDTRAIIISVPGDCAAKITYVTLRSDAMGFKTSCCPRCS